MNRATEGTAIGSVGLLSIAITVEDLDRATAWWQDVFRASLLTRGEVEPINARVAVLAGPGFNVELIEAQGHFRVPELDAEPPRHVLPIGSKAIALQTDDVATTTEELEAKGVTILWKNMEFLDQGPVTAIRDSEGNLMTIFGRKQGQHG